MPRAPLPLPILFKAQRKMLGQPTLRSGRLGIPAFMRGLMPLPLCPRLIISGITKDSAGTALGSCIVSLYRTAKDMTIMHDPEADDSDELVQRTTSDPTTGAYSFTAALGTNYYIRAYKEGSPDVAGTTRNDLVVSVP
ncbi:MAG: hypothetical protein ACREI9_13235 [Nitrospiraceae bacterium]